MIVGINGAKGSGKDTIGAYLVNNYGFTRVGFADSLKESAAALFKIDPDEWNELKNDPYAIISLNVYDDIGGLKKIYDSITVREFLQRYGTESHRDIFGDDFWVNAAMKVVRENVKAGNNVVITDMRFPNELEAVIDHGGQIWKVRRPEVEGGDGHPSEQVLDDDLFDVVFFNTGTIEALYQNLDVYVSELLTPAAA